MEGPSFTVEDLQGMRIVFKAFEEQIDSIDLGTKKAVSKPGLFIVDLLRDSNLSKDNAEGFVATLDNVLQVMHCMLMYRYGDAILQYIPVVSRYNRILSLNCRKTVVLH